MDHPLRVRVRDRVGHRDHVRHQREPLGERRGRSRRSPCRALARRRAHRVERLAARPPPGLVDRHDRRVLQARGDPRLALEARASRRGLARDQLLDRDRAAEPPVARRDDAAHAAARELAAEQVARGIDDAQHVRPAPARGHDRDLATRPARRDVIVNQRERRGVGVALAAGGNQELDELALRRRRAAHARSCHAPSYAPTRSARRQHPAERAWSGASSHGDRVMTWPRDDGTTCGGRGWCSSRSRSRARLGIAVLGRPYAAYFVRQVESRRDEFARGGPRAVPRPRRRVPTGAVGLTMPIAAVAARPRCCAWCCRHAQRAAGGVGNRAARAASA